MLFEGLVVFSGRSGSTGSLLHFEFVVPYILFLSSSCELVLVLVLGVSGRTNCLRAIASRSPLCYVYRYCYFLWPAIFTGAGTELFSRNFFLSLHPPQILAIYRLAEV
ncbi:hypothetical protein DFJ73DRAFT_814092, partial [Zopfochytrium polystomum]